jgi:hypothetical protein
MGILPLRKTLSIARCMSKEILAVGLKGREAKKP